MAPSFIFQAPLFLWHPPFIFQDPLFLWHPPASFQDPLFLWHLPASSQGPRQPHPAQLRREESTDIQPAPASQTQPWKEAPEAAGTGSCPG